MTITVTQELIQLHRGQEFCYFYWPLNADVVTITDNSGTTTVPPETASDIFDHLFNQGFC